MAPVDEHKQQICRHCGAVLPEQLATCTQCGRRLAENFITPQKREPAAPLIPWYKLKPILKVLVAAAILAGIGMGAYHGLKKIIESPEEAVVYPESPLAAAEEFFEAMQIEDYQHCYKLLAPKRKAATVINQQNRQAYYDHFARIREYLSQRAAEQFAENMQIETGSGKVVFENDITLTAEIEPIMGMSKKKRFSIGEIKEFPIDIVPGMGVEKYYRGLNRAIEGLGQMSEAGDDPAEVILPRPGESERQHLARMIEAFETARQLDTKHTILEWIVRQYSRQAATERFLNQIADDQDEPPQIRRLAEGRQ